MNFARPSVFWIAMLVAFVAVIVLLRGVLLPFVAAFVLAYLLDPIANKIDRLGLGRLAATLAIVVPVIIAIVVLLILTVPIIVRELANFVESLPLYIRRLHALANSSSQPWVSKIIGDGLGEVEHSIGALTAQASEWFDTFLHSIWSGGQALISMLSLVVVTPIIACYLLYHWNTMIAAIDDWVPPAQRETVRMLAREIDDTIGGFVRGQSALCLILAVFYAVALHLIGLEHGALIGFAAGVIGFIPYVGSLLGVVVSTSGVPQADVSYVVASWWMTQDQVPEIQNEDQYQEYLRRWHALIVTADASKRPNFTRSREACTSTHSALG
jgi:predicted PurR-regulated permease PerM